LSRISPACSRLLRDVGRKLSSWFDERRSRREVVELLSSRRPVGFSASDTRDRQSRADRSEGPHQSAFPPSELLVLRRLFRRERRSCETWPAPFLSKRRGRVRPLLRPRLSMPSINSASEPPSSRFPLNHRSTSICVWRCLAQACTVRK